MALPHNPVNRMCYQSKLIFLQIWPYNEAEQTQRWVSSTTGPFSLGECKGSFISSPTTADILTAWDIEKIPFIVKMTKGSEGLTSRWMGTSQLPLKLAQRFSAFPENCFLLPCTCQLQPAWISTVLTWRQSHHHTQPTHSMTLLYAELLPPCSREKPECLPE